MLPAFLALDAPPAPGSYEALRQAVPASTTVLLPAVSGSRSSVSATPPLLSSGAVRAKRVTMVRAAWALSHTRLLGAVDQTTLHLRTPLQAEPRDDRVADLVILPLDFPTWTLPPVSRQPIWWNDETAVYALDGMIDPIKSPPPGQPFPFSIRVSDVSDSNGKIAFTATFDNRAPDQWSGQDWIVIATEARPWNLPKQLLADGVTPASHLWFSGQIGPRSGRTSITYEFDIRGSSLALRGQDGALTPTQASQAVSGPGEYVLAVRLRHEYKPNQRRAVHYLPVLRITVSETGDVSYEVYEDVGD